MDNERSFKKAGVFLVSMFLIFPGTGFLVRILKSVFLMQAGGILTDNLGREAADAAASNRIIHAIAGVVLPYAP